MKVLCIEDNEEKYLDICEQLNKFHSISKIVWAQNGNDGLRYLTVEDFDLLILDMSLPINSFSTGKDMLYGECILDEIKRSRKNIKVVVVTGFDQFEYKTNRLTYAELHERLKKKFNKYLWGMIYYDQSSIEWSNTLDEIINNLEMLNL